MHLSTAQAAQILRVSEQRVRELLRDNELDGFRVGRAWVIHRDSVLDLAASRGAITPDGVRTRNEDSASSLKVFSFFSGAMGLDIGLERAGLETVLACENEKWCRATIAKNRPNLPLLADVSKYSPDEIRKAAGYESDETIDVIAGGPPCQAFSTAGARRGFKDSRGNVFLQFVDLASELRPRYIVIENVRGLLSAALEHRPHSLRGGEHPELRAEELPGGALKEVIATLRRAGYTVSFNLYNAANYGTPQIRERVVIICTRDEKRVPYLEPTHSKDALFGLPAWKTFRQAVAGLDESQMQHIEFPESRLRFYRQLSEGQYWKHLPVELQKEALGRSFYSGGGKTGFLRRLAWDRPAPTLVTHPAMPATDLAHPVEDRPLSIEEYKKIQQFPDDWELAGNLIAQYKQVGNAVPTGLGEAIGRALTKHSRGETWDEIADFRYSRYRRTDERSWFEMHRTSDDPSSETQREPTQLTLA